MPEPVVHYTSCHDCGNEGVSIGERVSDEATALMAEQLRRRCPDCGSEAGRLVIRRDGRPADPEAGEFWDHVVAELAADPRG